MALKLQETVKGIQCEYWKIISNVEDFGKNQTKSILGLYINQAQRETGVGNFIKREIRVFDLVDATREQIYEKWKESKKIEKRDEDGNIVFDGEGNPIMEETNKFAEAEDV